MEIIITAAGQGRCVYAEEIDLTTLGKYLAGGMSFGAFGGRRDLMAQFEPGTDHALTQAGTFNNNVVSMTAASVVLGGLRSADVLRPLNARGDQLRRDLTEVFAQAEPSMWVSGLGSMLCVHADDERLIEHYFHSMLAAGYYLARRGFMALSASITDDDCDALVAATRGWVEDRNRR